MDVVRLSTDTYLPDTIIEGYDSVIWTERQASNGEVQLKTPKVAETLNLLPNGSLISLLDSTEVMIIETQDVGDNDRGIPELTLTGRTFETFLENRSMLSGTYQQPWTVRHIYNTAEMCDVLAWTNLVNTTGEDPTRDATTLIAGTAVPNIVVTDSANSSEAQKSWSLNEGEVYKQLRDFLPLAALGIRNIRPLAGSANSGYVVTVDTSRTASRGNITKTLTNGINAIRLDIYQGTDRTKQQSVVTPVVFHYNSGHISLPKYLFSLKDLKNQAYVASSVGPTTVWADGVVAPYPTGLDLRVLFVDGGTQGTGQTTADFQTSLIQKGRVELAKHNESILFDGAISALAPYKYNEDYFLGDKVTLSAEYGFEASMVVTEFVRTQDQNGDNGYPTLVLAT